MARTAEIDAGHDSVPSPQWVTDTGKEIPFNSRLCKIPQGACRNIASASLRHSSEHKDATR